MSNTISIEVPCVNMNGNSRNDLLIQTHGVMEAIRTASQKVLSCDIYHGRNSRNPNHLEQLRKQRSKDYDDLLAICKRYEFILEEIQK